MAVQMGYVFRQLGGPKGLVALLVLLMTFGSLGCPSEARRPDLNDSVEHDELAARADCPGTACDEGPKDIGAPEMDGCSTECDPHDVGGMDGSFETETHRFELDFLPESPESSCGPDSCGDACGECQLPQHACVGGVCVCQPACEGKECGGDGCDGTCGECAGPQDLCVDGVCVCQPACEGKECGGDGCDGSCGGCPGPNESCVDGSCVCVPDCDGQCSDDGCGSSCPGCCGNGICEQQADESCDLCPEDCGDCECGNGVLEGSEYCDDGNTVDGDGCSAGCKLECCEDYLPGTIVITEIMNESKLAPWGVEWFEATNVSASSIELDGWTILASVTGFHTIDNCGPLTIHPGQTLVFGRNPPPELGMGMPLDYEYSGVSLLQEQEIGLVAPNATIVDWVSYGQAGFSGITGRALSLDGSVLDHDSNDLAENWCLATDEMSDDDFGTPGNPNPPCVDPALCGDGVVDPGEECDDGNVQPGDGCNSYCLVPIWGSSICGNGFVEGGEQCDDGNKVDGDCCGSTCLLTTCTCCYNPNCGDGIIQMEWGELCDDGNEEGGDGCDEWCQIEGKVCGNGSVELNEQCDDGNTDGGDGCAANCTWEWECTGQYFFGQLLITEVMRETTNWPVYKGKWFEVTNPGETPADFNGWVLKDWQGDFHFVAASGPVIVDPGQSVVLARDAPTLEAMGVQVADEYEGGLTLSLGVTLMAPDGTVVDHVYFKGDGFPSDKGHALSLDPGGLDYQANDLPANWCSATTPMLNGDFGTPGQANPACP